MKPIGRRRRLLTAFSGTLLCLVPMTSAQGGEGGVSSAPPFHGRILETPATRAGVQRLAVRESALAQTLAVTVHIVTAKVAGDEEYRALYGSTVWDNEAEARIEAADNQFYTNWGIDVLVTNFINWDSSPDGNSQSCGTLLSDLKHDVPQDNIDIVVGFTKQGMSPNAGGCAGPGDYMLIKYQGATNDWKVTQHELSHLYGADDVYGSENVHPNDVMEDPYNYPNKWCTYLQGSWDHFGTISLNSGKY